MTNINLNSEEKEKNQKNDTPDAFNVKFLKTRQILLSGEIKAPLGKIELKSGSITKGEECTVWVTL